MNKKFFLLFFVMIIFCVSVFARTNVILIPNNNSSGSNDSFWNVSDYKIFPSDASNVLKVWSSMSIYSTSGAEEFTFYDVDGVVDFNILQEDDTSIINWKGNLNLGSNEGIINFNDNTSFGADADFNSYKAIALTCDNGATLPTSAVRGQWFLHTPTGRTILMMYNGASWIPIYSFSSITMYVDGTLGTDNQNLGTSTGSNAFKTIQFAIDQIPPTNAGNINIFVASGNYEGISIEGKGFTGNYYLNITGSNISTGSPLINSSVGSVVYGNVSSVYPSPMIITATNNFTSYQNNGLRGYFVRFNNAGSFYVIMENTNSTISIVENVLTSGVTSFQIYPPPSVNITRSGGVQTTYSLYVGANQANVYFYNLNFKYSGAGPTIFVYRGAISDFTNCWFQSANRQNGMQNPGISFFRNSYIYNNIGTAGYYLLQSGGVSTLNFVLMYTNATTSPMVRIPVGGYVAGGFLVFAGNNQTAISSVGGGITIFNWYFKNLYTGVNADYASLVVFQNPTFANFVNVSIPISKTLNAWNSPFSNTTIGDGGISNYLTVNGSGFVSLRGYATVFDDINLPLFSAKVPSSGGADCSVAFKNNTVGCSFATGESLYGVLQMSHSYKLNSDINCHIHWSSPVNTTGNATWKLEYTKADINSAFPDSSSKTCTNAVSSVVYTHQLCDFGSIGNFSGLSGIANFVISRNTTDTATGEIFGLSLDCHYEKDKLGSDNETS